LEYNYAKEDSLFWSVESGMENKDTTQKIIENKVDYQRELLDFRNEKLAKKSGVITSDSDRIIDINEATEEDFSQLVGIGAKTAKNIIEYRRKIGKFVNVNQLMDVKGIGKTKFEKFKNRICVK